MKFDRKSIEGITPKEAWEFFVPMNVEEFMVSYLLNLDYLLMASDYYEMCHIHVSKLPQTLNNFFLQKDLDYIEDLLGQHIKAFVDEKGGDEDIDDEMVRIILEEYEEESEDFFKHFIKDMD